MIRKKSFKRETTHNGTLRTFVTFNRMKVSDDVFTSSEVAEKAYSAWAEVYDVSSSDMESFKGRFSKNALALGSIKSKAVKEYLTLKIRDPLTTFQPRNQDTVEVNDPRYSGKRWEVIGIQPDFYNRKFLVVYLSGG